MAATYAHVKESIRRRREWAQTLKDGPCRRCGKRLDPTRMHWHHRDPATKAFGIAKGVFRVGRERLLAEIAKCDLLCEDCHRVEHAPVHPSVTSYNQGCRCDGCREQHRLSMRDYRARRAGAKAEAPAPAS